MSAVLVTGGSGFFGSLLIQRLLDEGLDCVSIDLEPAHMAHPRLTAIQGDVRDRAFLARLFEHHRFETVYHCAAILSHAVKDKRFLWESNVEGTRNVAELASRQGVRSFVFLSSNCLWAENMHRPVREDDVPAPIEVYGRSKWEGECLLAGYADRLNVVTLRCPTIVDEGRLGLLTILFEFISEGRKVWVVGGGDNRYQFIYAQDLATACLLAARHGCSATFNVGSDGVTSFRDTYQYVIDRAGTGARLGSLPRGPTLVAMRLAHGLGVSPLGPYQYRMIAEDFIFDTSRIKDQLGWCPTLSNSEMLWLAYRYYAASRAEIEGRRHASAHRQAARMGAIRVLKWIS
jgi:nucleoside-diphosphate-sugar epimerase